jgi:hypothetical protein
MVTGGRDFSDVERLTDALNSLVVSPTPPVLSVGDCPTGADLIAKAYALAAGWFVLEFAADWATHGKAAGPLRNQAMVDAGQDLCIAFPLPDSRGTWDAVRKAIDAGIPVEIVR